MRIGFKGLALIIVIIGFMAADGYGQDKLEVETLQYDVERAELIKPVLKLQESYQKQLEKLRADVRASGSLKKTTAVDAEIQGFRSGDSPSPGDGFPELRRLQRIYASEARERHAKAARGLPVLIDDYRERLGDLQKEFTRANQLEEARKVKEALSKIDLTLGVSVPGDPVLALAVPAIVVPLDPTSLFQKGKTIFTNRDFSWGTIPKKFDGWRVSMQAGGNTAGSGYKVKTAGFVYSVIGTKSRDDFQKEGWKKIGELHGGKDGEWDYLVMEKIHEPGDYLINGKGWFATRILLPPSSPGK